ncbi:MEDIATOR OF RNA polymerase II TRANSCRIPTION SUBUNIT 26C-RELATED [Salix koriyanagi]|uniref:MEDIATOR OF RNA polymerase II TRANSCRIPTION SUBUNIT 26C-RELATED n=1 Tax=Salix koriyanagi TaxID=2511006 RepID=A0A9Q1AMS6_9ROSI|nr:MEDIATOR OF RNA polymerase II TRANSCRIPTION SUBUNIT 26C-RELATED [Salix koriyanagi]
MDIDDFRSILENSGVDVWTFIDTAIDVASLDFGSELKRRRDDIVARLFAASSSCSRCRDRSFDDIDINNTVNGNEMKDLVEKESSHEEDKGRRVSADSPPEDSLVDLLQSLADMDITFQALQETDIGRHVNRLRKHPSNDVKRLVKQLVRKWKEIVDDWVRLNAQGERASSGLMADGDSPHQKIPQNGRHQVPDFAYSPNPHNGSSGSDRNNSEPERKPKPAPPRNEALTKPIKKPVPASSSAPHNVQRQREQPKEGKFDADQKLASASKRLQANYKEAENAKKQRTIQVMDIHDIPKPKNKNTFFAKNRGGGGSHQGRHW